MVSHGIGLGGHPGPADAGGDHDRGDGTAAGYFAADMGGGVQRFTGGESCCIQKTGAFQHHLDGGFSRNAAFQPGKGVQVTVTVWPETLAVPSRMPSPSKV